MPPLIAIALSISISYSEPDADDLENEIISGIDSWRGSQPYIKNLDSKNFRRWRAGVVSRLIGLVNSCPATNISVFGLDLKTVNSLSIQQVIDSIGFRNPPSAKDVAEHIVFGVREGGNTSLLFNETPLSEACALSAIEDELTTYGLSIQRAPQAGQCSPRPFAGEFPRQVLEANLTPLEIKLYDNAVVVGNAARIRAFHDKVRLATGAEAEISPESADTLTQTAKLGSRLSRGTKKGRGRQNSSAEGGAAE